MAQLQMIPNPLEIITPKGMLIFGWSHCIRTWRTIVKCEYRGYEVIDSFDPTGSAYDKLCEIMRIVPKEIDFYLDAIWC